MTAGVDVSTEQVLALSLEDAIRLALHNNLSIERERLGPQIAQTMVERARAVFDPRVGLDANTGKTVVLPERIVTTIIPDPAPGTPATITNILRSSSRDSEVTPHVSQQVQTGGSYELRFINTREDISPSRTGTSGVIVNPRFESILELAFVHPLLKDFGIAVNTAPIRQAEKSVQIAEQQVLQTILDTIFAVQQNYWELIFRMQNLVTQRASQKLAEDFLAENKIRVELGTLAPIELVQAETRVKERQRDVIEAQAAVREADDLLKEVLNIPERLGTWTVRLQPTDVPAFAPLEAISLEEKVTFALQQRPDFTRSQLDIAIREIGRDVARHQLLPRLDVVGAGSVSGFGDSPDESVGNIIDGEGYRWSVGVQFEYPLGNRLARSDYDRQRLEVRQALIDQRRLVNAIVREVRQAVRDIQTAIQRVEVARATVVLAQTQLEAEQEKFRLGLSTSFNVLEFQEQLTRARSEEIRALSDYNIGLARLDLRTGDLRYQGVDLTK